MSFIFNSFLGKYCIVRSSSAGVFAGEIVAIEGNSAKIQKCRRLWYWCGAASLSELSQKGVSNPGSCKFPCEVPEMVVLEIVEVIPCSTLAIESIASVKHWSAH